MKKISIIVVTLIALAFVGCGGTKGAKDKASADSVRIYEQSLIEESIKMHLDSLAAEIGKLKQLPFLQTDAKGVVKLSKQELQVKPSFLLSPSSAGNAVTLAEKYRLLSALVVDRRVARLYEMPTTSYDQSIKKLMAEISDPAFAEVEDDDNLSSALGELYNAMDKNGRINYFWQMAAASLIEQLFVITQNSEKFLAALDDETSANCTFRIVLIMDALDRLSEYDPDIVPIAEALEPLEMINATTVSDLTVQIEEAREQIADMRKSLFQ